MKIVSYRSSFPPPGAAVATPCDSGTFVEIDGPHEGTGQYPAIHLS